MHRIVRHGRIRGFHRRVIRLLIQLGNVLRVLLWRVRMRVRRVLQMVSVFFARVVVVAVIVIVFAVLWLTRFASALVLALAVIVRWRELGGPRVFLVLGEQPFLDKELVT